MLLPYAIGFLLSVIEVLSLHHELVVVHYNAKDDTLPRV